MNLIIQISLFAAAILLVLGLLTRSEPKPTTYFDREGLRDWLISQGYTADHTDPDLFFNIYGEARVRELGFIKEIK